MTTYLRGLLTKLTFSTISAQCTIAHFIADVFKQNANLLNRKKARESKRTKIVCAIYNIYRHKGQQTIFSKQCARIAKS